MDLRKELASKMDFDYLGVRVSKIEADLKLIESSNEK